MPVELFRSIVLGEKHKNSSMSSDLRSENAYGWHLLAHTTRVKVGAETLVHDVVDGEPAEEERALLAVLCYLADTRSEIAERRVTQGRCLPNILVCR